MNDTAVLSKASLQEPLYEAASAFLSDDNDVIDNIKGTGAGRGLLIEILGPRHQQTLKLATFFRSYMVCFECHANDRNNFSDKF